MSSIKVGNVIPWALVPDGAMVRWWFNGRGLEYYYRRHAHVASLVGAPGMEWRAPGRDDGAFAPSEPVTIVALGLTGRESAGEVRRLAEVFEVREHLMRVGDDAIWYGQDIDDFAPLLHAAGWRPGMTAEDAARLLAAC